MNSITYAATAGQTVFDIPFGYLSQAHLYVEIDGVPEEDWDLVTSTSLELGGSVPPLLDDQQVTIYRETPAENLLVTFTPPSIVRASEINRAMLQLLYIAQESTSISQEAMRKNILGTSWDAESLPIKSVGTPEDAGDAATKGFVENLVATGGVLPIPTISDITKVVRVQNSMAGPIYALLPAGGARAMLRIPDQATTVVGQNLGFLVHPGGASGTVWSSTPSFRVPLAVNGSIGTPLLGAITVDANTFDILLPAGTWEYEVVGSVRSRTNTASTNSVACGAALTNEDGTIVYDEQRPVSLGHSGGASYPFAASASIHMAGYLTLGSTTRINLRLSSSTSADNVIADVPFRVKFYEIIR